MDSVTLKKLQLFERDMLCVVDKFCKENGIKYSLYAGTALGAVRHGGFIPWDDDIDICMERSEYQRFLKLWREKGVEGYSLRGTDLPDYEEHNHSKILKDGTLLCSKAELEKDYHHGIWIDIFPIDKVPTDKRLRKKVFFSQKVRLVYTRTHAFEKGGKFLKILSKMLKLIPRKSQLKIRNRHEKKILKYNNILTENYDLMSLSCPEGMRIFYPPNMLDEFTTIKFEDKEFSITTEWDKMLKANFGDYMKLPPEEQRICKHNPEILDFGE